MNDPRTTTFATISAVALGLAQIPGIAPCWQLSLVLTAVLALAAFGFFAADARPVPDVSPRLIVALAVLAGTGIAAGCTLGRLSLKVASPTFGSVQLSVGDGTIGRYASPPSVDVCSNPTPFCSTTNEATASTNNPPRKETAP